MMTTWCRVSPILTISTHAPTSMKRKTCSCSLRTPPIQPRADRLHFGRRGVLRRGMRRRTAARARRALPAKPAAGRSVSCRRSVSGSACRRRTRSCSPPQRLVARTPARAGRQIVFGACSLCRTWSPNARLPGLRFAQELGGGRWAAVGRCPRRISSSAFLPPFRRRGLYGGGH